MDVPSEKHAFWDSLIICILFVINVNNSLWQRIIWQNYKIMFKTINVKERFVFIFAIKWKNPSMMCFLKLYYRCGLCHRRVAVSASADVINADSTDSTMRIKNFFSRYLTKSQNLLWKNKETFCNVISI